MLAAKDQIVRCPDAPVDVPTGLGEALAGVATVGAALAAPPVTSSLGWLLAASRELKVPGPLLVCASIVTARLTWVRPAAWR